MASSKGEFQPCVDCGAQPYSRKALRCEPCRIKRRNEVHKRLYAEGRMLVCDPVYARASKLRRDYGLTLEQYEEMRQAQGGVCYLCLGKPKQENLSVDHSHKSGVVRKLLCEQCNKWLGVYQKLKDTDAIARFEAYLTEFGE